MKIQTVFYKENPAKPGFMMLDRYATIQEIEDQVHAVLSVSHEINNFNTSRLIGEQLTSCLFNGLEYEWLSWDRSILDWRADPKTTVLPEKFAYNLHFLVRKGNSEGMVISLLHLSNDGKFTEVCSIKYLGYTDEQVYLIGNHLSKALSLGY
ncbi:hypothetical protein THIAE_06265 [Thiomicrospira aerophila AL3]|uniref:Uncharacterized protein n=1 Tax=Thiomicrospira aerophila AL3 TaxID=717772 RepID=W0DZ99_9GAMM|nr:hypothetical protein [Thiomicrospira aerophila]AHF02309.1 hypothetical protein THIAE_06265 [Thiomicrospira aerophila AL3]